MMRWIMRPSDIRVIQAEPDKVGPLGARVHIECAPRTVCAVLRASTYDVPGPTLENRMILESLTVDAAAFRARAGWTMKPEGACKGDVCVPLPDAVLPDGRLDVNVLSRRLGMPLVSNDAHGIHALGPETGITGRALTTAMTPDIVLPDVDGRPVRVADLRPQRVVLVAWASW
jgi:hypothetical protein